MSLTLDRVYARDCLEGLRDLPAGCVDLVFADLPYGRTRSAWDRPVRLALLWPALRRACKPRAAMVFTGVQPFSSLLVCSNLAEFRFSMVWRKNKSTGFLNAKRQPLRAHEDILVFARKAPRYRPRMTEGHEPGHAVKGRLSKTSIYGATPVPRSWGGSTKRYSTSVLEVAVVNGDAPDRGHVNQKPEALSAWFIEAYTDPGDLVLDPTAGSGSALAAAKRLGRRFVGFEQDAKTARAANARLSRVAS